MAASPRKKTERERQEGIEIPIRWEYPDDLPTVYAGHIVIRHTRNDFTINFFQIRDPSGTTAEQPKIIESQKHIAARCVARIAVSPGTMGEILEAMQDNYQKYLSQLQDSQSEGG